MAEFEPPEAVTVYGEGLSSLSLDEYTHLLETLGQLGLRATVHQQDQYNNRDLTSRLRSDEEAQEVYSSLTMTTEQTAKEFAESRGFSTSSISSFRRGWEGL